LLAFGDHSSAPAAKLIANKGLLNSLARKPPNKRSSGPIDSEFGYPAAFGP